MFTAGNSARSISTAFSRIVAASIILYYLPALAETLPKSAEPMAAETIKLMFSGNSATWKDSDIYFLPDGSVKGIFGKPVATAAIEGTWSVTENRVCIYTFRSKRPGSFSDCYQWWHDGKRTISFWSPRSDGSTADLKNGYRSGEEMSLKVGDIISNRLSAVPGF